LIHASQKEEAGMNAISKVFVFFSILFTPLWLQASALSAIAGHGTGLVLIPNLLMGGISDFFSHWVQVIVLGVIIGLPILFLWIGIQIDKYIIRTTISSVSRSFYIAIIANGIVYVTSTIIFTPFPFVFEFFESNILAILAVVVTWGAPIIWFIVDVTVYAIVFRVMAAKEFSRAFFYRLIGYDLLCIGIFSVVIWFPFLLSLLQKFRY
jgi:hypothetical protein